LYDSLNLHNFQLHSWDRNHLFWKSRGEAVIAGIFSQSQKQVKSDTMEILDLTEETRMDYFICLEEWSNEMKPIESN